MEYREYKIVRKMLDVIYPFVGEMTFRTSGDLPLEIQAALRSLSDHAESAPEHPDTPRSSPGTSPHSPLERPNDTSSTTPNTEPSPRQDPESL